jgi:hypothetical protein
MKLNLYTTAKISPSWKVNKADLKRWGMNMLVFSAPTLVVFFGQLRLGVPMKEAWPVAALVLYGSLMDLFKKFKDGKH